MARPTTFKEFFSPIEKDDSGWSHGFEEYKLDIKGVKKGLVSSVPKPAFRLFFWGLTAFLAAYLFFFLSGFVSIWFYSSQLEKGNLNKFIAMADYELIKGNYLLDLDQWLNEEILQAVKKREAATRTPITREQRERLLSYKQLVFSESKGKVEEKTMRSLLIERVSPVIQSGQVISSFDFSLVESTIEVKSNQGAFLFTLYVERKGLFDWKWHRIKLQEPKYLTK